MLDTNGTLKLPYFWLRKQCFELHNHCTNKDELNATTEGNFTINLNNITEAPYFASGGGGEFAHFTPLKIVICPS